MSKKYILSLVFIICIAGCCEQRSKKDELSQTSSEPKAPVLSKSQREFEIYTKNVHNIYFGINESSIKDESALKIKKLISELEKVRNVKVLLYGYTDKTGSKAYNRKLTARRINAIKTMLIRSGVIKTNKISIETKIFDEDPLISYNTIDNNPESRRVDVYIVKL